MARPIVLTDGSIERERIATLESMLRTIIRMWDDPGPMGSMYQMERAVSYARFILDDPRATP